MIEPPPAMVRAVEKAIAAATHAGTDPAIAAATAAAGVLSGTFAMAARGRRQYLRTIEGDDRFAAAVDLLRIEITTLDSVRRVIEGELGPLYNWLPAHLWTRDMLSRLYDPTPSEQPAANGDLT